MSQVLHVHLPKIPWPRRAATISITLTGKATPQVALNSVLVIDRSGSMGDPAYTMSTTIPKIEALESAISVYYDALRVNDTYSGVTFNSSPAVPVGWTTKTTNASTIDAALQSGASGMVPTGSTSIGSDLDRQYFSRI
ncbi:MAG: VWA domain-containing protein [Bacteroidota bacterium]